MVRESFEGEPEFQPAVRSAVFGALTIAGDNALLKAVLESGHTGDTDLLPYIFQSQTIIDTAAGFLFDLVVEHFPTCRCGASSWRWRWSRSSGWPCPTSPSPTPPARTADDLAWVVGAVLAGVAAQQAAAAAAPAVAATGGSPAAGEPARPDRRSTAP